MDEEDAMIQTRSETNGIHHYRTVKEAFAAADKDETIWKISFYLRMERVRLVREGLFWDYEELLDAVDKLRG